MPDAKDRIATRVVDGLVGAEVRDAVAAAGGTAGIDIAVSVPGGGNFSPVLAYDDDDFSATIDANVRPIFLLLKYAGKAMVKKGGGSIVAVSSTAAVMSSPFLAAYCAAKAACDQLVKVAADELGRQGVRIAHHIDFPDYSESELMQIATLMLQGLNYRFDDEAEPAFARYVGLRRQQPHFANARSVRNALDRIRLRHATRLFDDDSALTRDQLCTLQAQDILASRVFETTSLEGD